MHCENQQHQPVSNLKSQNNNPVVNKKINKTEQETIEFFFDKKIAFKKALKYITKVYPERFDDRYDKKNPVFASINAVTDNGEKVKMIIVLFPNIKYQLKSYAYVKLYLKKGNQLKGGEAGFTIESYKELLVEKKVSGLES